MIIVWKYLKPQKWLIALSLLLAGISQALSLVDPLIFGKIIDEYATNPGNRTQDELVSGVLYWLGIAVGVAIFARVAKSFQESSSNKKASTTPCGGSRLEKGGSAA